MAWVARHRRPRLVLCTEYDAGAHEKKGNTEQKTRESHRQTVKPVPQQDAAGLRCNPMRCLRPASMEQVPSCSARSMEEILPGSMAGRGRLANQPAI